MWKHSIKPKIMKIHTPIYLPQYNSKDNVQHDDLIRIDFLMHA